MSSLPLHLGSSVASPRSSLRQRAARTACLLAFAGVTVGCASAGGAAGKATRPEPPGRDEAAATAVEDEGQTQEGEKRAGAEPSSPTDPKGRSLAAKTGDGAEKDEEAVPGAAWENPAAPGVTPGDKRPRVWAPASLVRIFDTPDRDAPVIGAMRNGQSVLIREGKPVTVRTLYQCTGGWYPVEPRGWVCVGGPGHGTLDGNDLAVRAAAAALPDLQSPYPFKFGVSVGAPHYQRIPTAAEQRQAEPGLDAYLASLPAADPSQGGAIDSRPAGHGPPEALQRYLQQSQLPLVAADPAYEGMKVSWAREFDANGRTWLLTPDVQLVPKDKVRQQPLPMLRGVDLRAAPDMQLPLAFTWLEDAVKYTRDDKGKIVPTGEKWPRHTFIGATGGMAKGDHGRWYWETRDGHLAYYPDVTIIKNASARPSGVGPTDKWVHVRVTWGWLVAYEGDSPVYVTAISPGIDGISARAHATAKGKHFVDWKMLSGDMSGRDKGKDWFVDEVPWVQYYKDNFAIHGAWWHNDFGRPKSHGCINVPPAAAQWLFRWMDPVVPEGWYAISPRWPHTKSNAIYIQY